MRSRPLTCLTTLVPLALSLGAPAPAQEAADRIWQGGPVITMVDAQPRAEALAVRDGKILAVGAAADVMAHRGDGTEVMDLGGRPLLPGFVDAHGHVFMIGLQALSANMLPAPDGEVNDIPTLQRVLREWAASYPRRVEAGGMILGFGYDDAQLAELRHPTRDELDAVSQELPVVVIHQSSHLGVLNSAALELVGYSASSENPPGGVIRRREGTTEPNGVLEEAASSTLSPDSPVAWTRPLPRPCSGPAPN